MNCTVQSDLYVKPPIVLVLRKAKPLEPRSVIRNVLKRLYIQDRAIFCLISICNTTQTFACMYYITLFLDVKCLIDTLSGHRAVNQHNWPLEFVQFSGQIRMIPRIAWG